MTPRKKGDAATRTVLLTSWLNENWTYTNDKLHRMVTATDPLSQVTTYQYDHSAT